LSQDGHLNGLVSAPAGIDIKVIATDSSVPAKTASGHIVQNIVNPSAIGCTGPVFALFDNWNGTAVGNNGLAPSKTLRRDGLHYCVVQLVAYNFNDGVGPAQQNQPIVLGINDAQGNSLGTFTAAGSTNAQSAGLVNWTA